jgi:Fe-S cluster assembly protein SufD
MAVKELIDIKSDFLKSFEQSGEAHFQNVDLDVTKLARQAINDLEFPTSRTEAWKYTRVGRISKASWKLNEDDSEISRESYTIPGLECHMFVMVNGIFRSDLSDLPGNEESWSATQIGNIEAQGGSQLFGNIAEIDGDIFTALNTANVTGGCAIHVPKGVVATKPIHIVQITTIEGTGSNPRMFLVAEESSEVHVVVSTLSEVKGFTNMVSEVFVGENAKVTIDKIQSESSDSFQISTDVVRQAANSRFNISTVTTSGGLVRNNLTIKVEGEGCETHLNGAYFPKGKEHVDNHTIVDHMVPHCESNELYKGIVGDKATAVFNGKVFVRPDAQKTNAFQQNANILQSDDATVNSKPELEIYADDVRCSHGSTTGQFDEEAVFYLKSRGIPESQARDLLIRAFVGEVFDLISNESVSQYAESLLLGALAAD